MRWIAVHRAALARTDENDDSRSGLRERCNSVAFVCIDKDISHILQAAFAFISTPSSAIARAFVRIQSLTVAHFEGKVLQAAITSGSSFKNSQSFSNNAVPCLLPFCMQETPKLLIFVINAVAIFDISRLLLTIREFLVTIGTGAPASYEYICGSETNKADIAARVSPCSAKSPCALLAKCMATV